MLKRFMKVAALAIPALAVVGCAHITRPQTYGLDESSAALVRQTCQEVMGIRAGFAEFDACSNSLADSVRSLHDSNLIARANDVCESQGHEKGSADLAKCVVISKRAEAQTAAANLKPASVPADGLMKVSYFSMSNSQQHERVELSCAQLGLHPATGSFRSCVMDLKQAIFTVQNPM